MFPLEKVGLLIMVLKDPVNVIRHPLPHLNVPRIVKLYVLHLLVISPVHVSWIIDMVSMMDIKQYKLRHQRLSKCYQSALYYCIIIIIVKLISMIITTY